MKSAYKITGGKPIKGTIRCLGAKNFATKAMVAALLTREKSVLTNVPDIGDIDLTLEMLTAIGVKVEYDKKKNSLLIDPSEIKTSKVPCPDSGSNRIPILLLSPLLHRFGKAEVPVLGGCNIGKRNVDFHIEAIRKFGGVIRCDESGYTAYAKKGLKSTHITLPYPSVGATETCLFLSVLAKGTTVIENTALEPEIIALITMLRSMGAIIFTSPGRTIKVEGISKLQGTKTKILGDRIEGASWACLACASDGEIIVEGIIPETLGNFLSYYQKIGGGFELIDEEKMKFYRKSKLSSTNIETDVYPGFSTDWQQPFAILLTQAEGTSKIHETVYEQRFGYLEALNKLGANTTLSTNCLGNKCRFEDQSFKHSAIIKGPTLLNAQGVLEIPDLRAGLAYLIAAAIAKGTTTLKGIEMLERGYGNLPNRLRNILKIEKVTI
jgi:UDP-N-acetylglucosamine 1-carboxyvinyltransferase